MVHGGLKNLWRTSVERCISWGGKMMERVMRGENNEEDEKGKNGRQEDNERRESLGLTDDD